MKRWPLRWQLALLASALVAVVLLAVGSASCWQLYREGVSDLDRELRHVSREFYINVAGAQQIDWGSRMVMHDLLPPAHYPYSIEVMDAQGRVLHRSRPAGEEALPSLREAPQRFATLQVEGHLLRVAHFEEGGIQLRLAMALHTVEQARDHLLRSFLIAAPFALLAIAAGGWLIARRALAPIQQIASSAERISAQRLDQRLPLPRTGDEIERLTVVLNHTFDRLEASFHQATRFTADASHELKTPLTVIRGELEAAIRDGQAEPPHERLLINLLEETERLSQISDGLLLLSRADAGRLTLELRPTELLTLLQDLLEDAEILAAASQIEVEARLPAAACVQAAPQFLRQMLLNLLDNAIKYNEPRGRVRIALREEESTWVLSFGNTGPGVDPADAEQLFDRFFRGDKSRSSERTGHGLGLSICREIARAHGGEISLHLEREGWTEFRVQLVKAPARDCAQAHNSGAPSPSDLSPAALAVKLHS